MKKLSIFLLSSLVALSSFARKNINSNKNAKGGNPQIAAGCTAATTATDLDINNIKLKVQTGGDMWWDLTSVPKFEVPKNSGKHSMFAGSLWLGGKDVSGQLKVAAQEYRSNGVDFWTGPLSTINFDISSTTCAAYDKHYATTRIDIDQFAKWYEAGIQDAANGTNTQTIDFPDYVPVPIIYDWPAHGRDYDPYNEDFYLAPFFDRNGDGIYDPYSGDYPGYELNTGNLECGDRKTAVYGDQNLWWVFNDKGNVHTETGSNAIGMEIRAQAFSFATNDEVNNMTFCNYELVNRSSFTLTETYFGVFCDPDLGGALDDYVGCDVTKGLGYCYNGDDQDLDNGGAKGYGTTPPAIGIDFFEGPYQDADGIDNAEGIGEGEALNGIGYGDGVVDNERYGMRRFVWFNNGGASCCSDPGTGTEYYNYLRSYWKDGARMVFGGTGHPNSGGTIPTDFMFPGTSDPLHWGTGGIDPNYADPRGWTEAAEGTTPNDRRFIQSAGPFTLFPGAVNDITVGIVWAQSATGGAQGSLDALLKADEKTQALFDNCFRLLGGPDAPVLATQELDKEIILYITNPTISNNRGESYSEKYPFIIAPDSSDTNGDGVLDHALTQLEKDDYSSYKFQGYKVYQVKDNTVDVSSLKNIDKARLVYQGDIRDGVSSIVNVSVDPALNVNVYTEEVAGNDLGIKHSIKITEDLFATGNRRLINHKTYYFIAVAYAYNNYIPFDPNNPESQTRPYLPSRKSPTGAIKLYSAIPHNPSPENGGTVSNSVYGDAVELTRIEGTGNGGLSLTLKKESVDSILLGAPWIVRHPVYEVNGTPLTVKVVDPLNVKGGNFSIQFKDTTNNGSMADAYYVVYNLDVEDSVLSSQSIAIGNEELILNWGISIYAEQPEAPGVNTDGTYGVIAGTISFLDQSKPWLTGIPDIDGDSLFDWIAIGTGPIDWPSYETYTPYETILNGTWAPARLCSNKEWGPLPKDLSLVATSPVIIDRLMGGLADLNGVDIVFTDDKTKWTRCPVIEMGWSTLDNKGELGVGPSSGTGSAELPGALKGRLRQSPSIDKDGNFSSWPATTTASTNESDPNYIGAYGMGWFPGYAINVETGERLNMAYGENSMNILEGENGSDMQWNPTDRIVDNGFFGGVRLAGEHYLFVFRNNTVRQNEPYVYFDEPSERMPAYDYGQFAYENLAASTPAGPGVLYDLNAVKVYGACMWIGFPVLELGSSLLETKATISLRVRKPFEKFGTKPALSIADGLTLGQTYLVNEGPVTHKGDTLYKGDTFIADTSFLGSIGATLIDVIIPVINQGLPMYNYNTTDIAAVIGDDSTAASILGLINVVPNPYYAYSKYEQTRLDNRIKIVNLPNQCTITIYSINGTLIRQLLKDDATQTFIDWDLKNFAKVPVASGVYLIHVDVPGVGEVVLKWFGALRPTDLDSF